MQKVYPFMWWNMCLDSFESWEWILQFVSTGLTKLDETICYCWCPIVMRWSLWLQQWSLWLHHCDVIHWDKQSCVTMAVDLNLCVSVTWPLNCAFHIPCTHTPEIIDMHRGVCDKWDTDQPDVMLRLYCVNCVRLYCVPPCLCNTCFNTIFLSLIFPP